MMDACYIGVHDVRDAEFARKSAIWKFITDHPRLMEEFMQDYVIYDRSLDVTSPEYYEKLGEFANKKGFKIADEHPFIKFDENKQTYCVDVCYKIIMR